MSLFVRPKLQAGFNHILPQGSGGLEFVDFGVLVLPKGKTHEHTSKDREVGLVVISGKARFSADGTAETTIGERNTPFEARAWSVFIPPGNSYRLEAVTDCEIAVASAPSSKKGDVAVLDPSTVKSKSVGRDNWRRDVYDCIADQVDAEKLVIGETINPPGNWSSYPPHRHDEDNPPHEVDMEEVYYFKVDPPDGFGMQRIYTLDRSLDEAYVIEQNNAVAIAEGYHPVAAAGGYKVYYLWILAGRQRVLAPCDDPAHAWVKEG